MSSSNPFPQDSEIYAEEETRRLSAVTDDAREAVSSRNNSIGTQMTHKGFKLPRFVQLELSSSFLKGQQGFLRKKHRRRAINLLPMITETKETACTTFVPGPSSISRHWTDKDSSCNPLRDMSGLSRSCPSMSKHGKTKISANRHYPGVTAAWVTSHVWDVLTFPGISIAVLKKKKKNLHAPVWVTGFCKRLAPHAGCFRRVNVLCFSMLFESGIRFQQLSDPYSMNSQRVG